MSTEVAATTAYALLLDFERRALGHRVEAPEAQTGPALWRGLCVDMTGIETMVGIGEIAEILVPPPLTYVPGAQPWLRGIANLRGTLLTVVDLGHFLFGVETVHDDRNRILVARQRAAAASGLLVSAVLGQRGFDEGAAVAADEVVDPRLLPFVPFAYGNSAGDHYWPVLSLQTLMRSPVFLDAAA